MPIDLDKRNETLTLSLTKKKISSIRAQVGTVFDRSGSMNNLYKNGTMQEYANRLVPLGIRFDDNGSIDNWAFHTKSYKTDNITLTTIDTFVRNNILPITPGGTSYAPVLNDIYEHYFGKNSTQEKQAGFFKGLFTRKDSGSYPQTPIQDPVYLIFQTDGENSDQGETDKLLAKIEKQGMYVQFVGIGTENFSFLKKMADKYSNVGFFSVRNLETTSDETLYDLLINDEFKTFLKTRFPNNIQEI